MFTFLACQTHFGKIGANIIKSHGGAGECWKSGRRAGKGWGNAGEASTPFYINTAKMQSSLAEDRQLGRSERGLCSLPVPCSVALKFLCVCIIAVHANLAMLQGSRTINTHI